MRHGRKGCGRTDKEKLRGASRRQHKRERRGVCVYPSCDVSIRACIRPARVGCLQKSLSANEFSQHRHRSFRLVIASLQIGATVQRRVQRKHFETTLETPPAHTHTGCGRTDKDKLRGASRRHHKRQTRGVCVCVSVLGCVYASVYPSCARWLLAKKVWLQKSFRSIVIVVFAL